MTLFVFHTLKGKSFSLECPDRYEEEIDFQLKDEQVQFIDVPGYRINKLNINYVEVRKISKRK